VTQQQQQRQQQRLRWRPLLRLVLQQSRAAMVAASIPLCCEQRRRLG
jgi:hypothetical protein